MTVLAQWPHRTSRILHRGFSSAPSLAAWGQLTHPYIHNGHRLHDERASGSNTEARGAASAVGHVPHAKIERADAVLKYWWAASVPKADLSLLSSAKMRHLLLFYCRLGDTYLTDPPQHVDPERKKLWFMGGPETDQVPSEAMFLLRC